jgi:leucyl-tRNA synthetase
MTIGEFLKENKLSVGDNFKFLLERLGVYQEEFVKKVESAVGETAKMSKSKANTVDPEDMVNSYGADTVRLYILFAGPVEKDFEWTEEGLQGAHRFLKRLWSFFHENLERLRDLQYTREELSKVEGKAKDVRKKAHQTLKKYLQDMEELSFNTAIAGIMELLNTLQDFKPETQADYKVLKEALELILLREELSKVEGKAKDVRKKAHQTLKKYLQDMEELSFNTAIAGIMELLNTLQDFKPETQADYKVLKEALELILFMLYPITPHICEELWNKLGHQRLMVFYTFPQPDPEALKEEEVEVAVQVNGKLKAVIKVPIDAQEDTVKSIALAQEKVAKALENKKLQKIVYVKNKLINLVVRDE